MPPFFRSKRFRRPSRLRDRYSLSILSLLLLLTLASFLVSRQMGREQVQTQNLLTWETRLDDGALLLLLIFVWCGYRLRKQIYSQEARLDDVEQELRREKHGLEQRVRERTVELRAEVDERRRADLLNRGRNQILEMLEKNEDIHAILKVLVETVTEQRSTWLATLHQLQKGALELRASVGIPEVLMERLQHIEANFLDAPEAASLQRQGTYILENTTQQRTPWSQLLLANRIYSAWSAPFFSPDGVAIGAITTYALLVSKPTARDLELLEMACSMAALIFEHQRLQQELLHHAYHDVLTNLPNRRLGEDRLGVAITRAKRNQTQVAVLWADLDHFKEINDTYGHPTGDRVLQEVARRLSQRLREADTVARMGGDEFMIVLENTQGCKNTEEIAAKLHGVVAQPLLIDAMEFNITASIGISIFPTDGETVEDLKQNADHAMYRAKFERTGTCSYSPAMSAEALELRELREELTLALHKNGYEIDYQPQCNPNGSIVAFEALLRFRHPRLGTVPPSKFIPIAEETQLIVPLGSWVLRHVCLQNMEWQRMGYTVPIAVNISAIQFARKDFADSVAAILAETGLDPALLELELTESMVMKDFSESARQMNSLHQLGIRIAIDDFGTGYSSLSCLHRLPIDVLKIDRSFIEKLTEVEGTRPIVEAVISMGHTLGLRVVAEGVETSEQSVVLRESDCDLIQGYFFSTRSDPTKPLLS